MQKETQQKKEYRHPVKLRCDNCHQIIPTGIFSVSQHSIDCPVYEDEIILTTDGDETGFTARRRPKLSFTPIYYNSIEFKRLVSTLDHNKVFNTYISEDNLFRIDKDMYKFGEWVLKPNINNPTVVEKFYKLFTGTVRGTIDYCIQQAQLYYNDNSPADK